MALLADFEKARRPIWNVAKAIRSGQKRDAVILPKVALEYTPTGIRSAKVRSPQSSRYDPVGNAAMPSAFSAA